MENTYPFPRRPRAGGDPATRGQSKHSAHSHMYVSGMLTLTPICSLTHRRQTSPEGPCHPLAKSGTSMRKPHAISSMPAYNNITLAQIRAFERTARLGGVHAA